MFRSTGISAKCAWQKYKGNWLSTPTKSEVETEADSDLIVAASETSIVMVEGEMNEVSDSDMIGSYHVLHTKRLSNK